MKRLFLCLVALSLAVTGGCCCDPCRMFCCQDDSQAGYVPTVCSPAGANPYYY